MRRFFQSLRYRMLLPVIFIAAGIAILLTALVSNAYTQSILQQTRQNTTNAFTIIGNTIIESLAESDNAVFKVLNNNAIQSYGMKYYSSAKEKINLRKSCTDYIEQALAQQPFLNGILFVRKDGSYFGVAKPRVYFADNPQEGTLPSSLMEYCLYNDIHTSAVLCYPYSSIYGSASAEVASENVLVRVQPVGAQNKNMAAVISIIDIDTLQRFVKLLDDSESDIFLSDGEGNEVIHVGSNSGMSAKTVSMLWQNDVIYKRVKSDGKDWYCMVYPIDQTGLFLVKEFPLITIRSEINRLQLLAGLAALMVTLVFTAVYYQWLNRFLRTFNTLKNGIISLRRGKLKSRIDSSFTISEFEDIRLEFNAMNETIEQMIVKSAEAEREQLELELRNLQTQLSPHMIFNSITAIRWLSVMLGADRVAQMLQELSEMLRPVLREWRLQWTIREELQHLTHYTRLLDLRYGNHFQLEAVVPEDLMDNLIPRFTIQPLVENACEHGGIPDDGLQVKIEAERKDNGILIKVQNNGEQLTREQIERINQSLKEQSRKQHIGLSNVYHRIRICMGEGSDVSLSCTEDGKMLVSIWWKCGNSVNIDKTN